MGAVAVPEVVTGPDAGGLFVVVGVNVCKYCCFLVTGRTWKAIMLVC